MRSVLVLSLLLGCAATAQAQGYSDPAQGIRNSPAWFDPSRGVYGSGSTVAPQWPQPPEQAPPESYAVRSAPSYTSTYVLPGLLPAGPTNYGN